jgi:hypothetical protein
MLIMLFDPQGVCLIDWGRSIDTTLFTDGTEFVGDSKTDGFRCTEMLEKKPWTYQVFTLVSRVNLSQISWPLIAKLI